MARAGMAFMEYSKYVTRIIEDRRQEPRDDLVSILTGAKDEGLLRRLPDMEYAAGGPVFKPSALVHTCAELAVRFTPEGRRAA
jgi:cytochrome P450